MKYVRILLVAVLTMSAASILLLLLAALVLAKTGSLYKAFLPVIATVIGCVAVLLGALASAAAAGEKGWIVGLLCAALFAVCIAVPSGLALETAFTAGSAAKLAALFLSGAIGGILGVNRKQKMKF